MGNRCGWRWRGLKLTFIDVQGNTHAVWGEGYSYDTPGSIWYTTGRAAAPGG
jgi:hypothetical protein